MTRDENNTSVILLAVNETSEFLYLNRFNYSTNPTEAVVIAFHIGRIISLLCVILGIFGNITLIYTICRSTFFHFSYGLLLLFISSFDIMRLISATIYYLIQANIIPLTLPSVTIYVTLYRYPKIVTNWLKVVLAVERFLAVKYWINHRYNIHSNNAKQVNRLRQRKLFLIILLILLCALIIQHPNFIPYRFISTRIDSTRLLIINEPNPNFYYGNHVFNGVLFTVVTYIILDDLLPIILLVAGNTCLLYELKHLPAITSKKLADSVFILFFLTVFSIFVAPRSFLVVFNVYANQEYINSTTIAVTTHTFQGVEMINHAITGYACFLSCRGLRRDFIRNLRLISEKFQRTKDTIKSSSIELATLPQEHL